MDTNRTDSFRNHGRRSDAELGVCRPRTCAHPNLLIGEVLRHRCRGGNDCGTATHSCAGESTKARDPASWLYLPAGTCTRIEGGSLTAKG